MSSSEKRAYCEFVNDLWKGDLDFLDIIPINTNNDDVYSVLDKGIILCKLVNKIVDNTIDEKEFKADKAANLKLFFYGAQTIGCKLENITVQNLIEGSKPHLLDAVGKTIKHYYTTQLAKVDFSNLLNQGEKSSSIAPEELVIRWVNYHLEKSGFSVRRLSNLDTDLQDAENYAVLLSQIAPNQISSNDLERAFKEKNTQKRALIVLKLAEKINANKFLTPDDILQGNAKLNFLFLANLIASFSALGPTATDLAVKKTKDLESQIDMFENLLAEAMSEKDTLLNQLDDALFDFESLEKEIGGMEMSLDDLLAETAQISSEKETLEDLFASISKENKDLEDLIEKTTEEHDDLFAQLEAEISMKLDIETELKSTRIQLDDLIADSTKQISTLNKKVDEKVQQKEDFTNKLQEVIQSLEKAKTDSKAAEESLTEKLANERKIKESLNKNLEDTMKKLEESKNIVAETENTKDELFKLLNETIGEVETAKSKTNEIQFELRAAIDKEVAAKQKATELLRKKNEEYDKALAAWNIEREGLLHRIKQLEEDLANLKADMKYQLEKAEKEMQEALELANLERQRLLAEAENEKDMALDKVRLLLTGNQKQGYLWKQEKNLVGTVVWNKKFFVLRDNLFCWYNKEKDVGSKAKPQGVVYCEEARIYELNEDEIKRPFAFQIDNEKLKANIAADSLEEMKEWVTEIRVSKKKKIGVKVVSEETKEKRG